MKRLILCLSLFLGLMGCMPTAVSEVVSSPMVTKTDLTTEMPTFLPAASTLTPTTVSYAETTSVQQAPTAPPSLPTATPSLIHLITPTAWSHFISSGSIIWITPSTWWPVRDVISTSIENGNLLYAASNIPFDPLLITKSEPHFPEGFMLMMLQSTLDSPESTEGQEVKIGEQHTGRLLEETTSEIFPFGHRHILSVKAYANRYALSLACVPPSEADSAEMAAFASLCNHIWQQMVTGFAIQPIGMASECPEVDAPPDKVMWRGVTSDWYRYSFDVPSHWFEIRGVTPDRLGFLNDPAIYDQPNFCALPYGLMKLDFSVDPPGNFGTGAPDSAPDVEGFTELTVAAHQAWIQTVQGGELTGPADFGTTVYIKGDNYWYHFWLLCMPPTDADAASQDTFKAQCGETLSQILVSFEIR